MGKDSILWPQCEYNYHWRIATGLKIIRVANHRQDFTYAGVLLIFALVV